MLIREGHLGDEAAIARVHVESWKRSYRGLVPDEVLERLSVQAREKYWFRRLAGLSDEETSIVYVVEDGGEIVGFASAGPERDGDPVYKGELYAIYLLPGYQRLGLGRRLVAAVGSRFLAIGVESMLVWVLAQNPARGFYAALGGQPLRKKPTVIDKATVHEVAYGWKNVRDLLLE